MLLPDLAPLFLTIKLAVIATLILIVLGTPIAWWLATTRLKIKPLVEALVALPIVLPPTVIGFYLLILLSPQGTLGSFWVELTGQALTFSFSGLVIASVIYSFPFVVQPLQGAFETVGKDLMEAAHTLGAKPLDAFFSVAVPMAKRGYLTATVLGFAHTLGEFGVVLMIGGNIPGETRLISIAIYDHVESLEYAQAHMLSFILISFAFVSMLMMYVLNYKSRSQ
ncbi:MAG: molybdate ABC transporter permease subunit [Gammaproteobacteria bacterium]|nr:molybdate ABC transporter permease subunit [Gammaproteobacteria bacterium]